MPFKQLEGRVEVHQISNQSDVSEITQMLSDAAGSEGFHICIDGLLGMAFSPPLCAPVATLIEAVNTFEAIDLRASVDLPSGKGDGVKNSTISFQADFTYATGIAKKPIFEGIAECGRIRYIDLGFEAHQMEAIQTKESILTSAVLDPIRCLRPAAVDKRAFGHLFIVGGSAYMPGALLMAVKRRCARGLA